MSPTCPARHPSGSRCVRPPHEEHTHPDGPRHIDAQGRDWRSHVVKRPAWIAALWPDEVEVVGRDHAAANAAAVRRGR